MEKYKGYITKEYNYVYKIINVLTGKIYIGCHQTNDLDDGYMGSGKYLNRAYEKHGIDNFVKEIINFYETPELMFAAEAAIVTKEFVNEDTNYNLSEGGKGGYKSEAIYASPDRSAKIRAVHLNKVAVRIPNGKVTKISKDDPRWISKELCGATKGKTTVKDLEGNVLNVDRDDPRLSTGELVGVTKGLAMMKDLKGNVVQVDINDPRIKAGELVGVTKGSTQTAESNAKRSAKTKGIPKEPILVTCICCKKTTILLNFIRWHKNCSTNMI